MKKRKTIIHRISFGFLALCLLIGVFHRIISNDIPIYCETPVGHHFPALNQMIQDWTGLKATHFNKNTACTSSLYPPLRYSFNAIGSAKDKLLPPLHKGRSGIHLMGTDVLGKDIFAGILRGFFITLRISLLATLLAYGFGVGIGLFMAMWQDQLKVSLSRLMLLICLCCLVIFYLCYPSAAYGSLLVVTLLIIGLILWAVLGRWSIRHITIPFDTIIMKVIELLKSIPALVILLVLLPIVGGNNINLLVVLIAFFSWKNFALHARAEGLALKEEAFVTQARALGQTTTSILIKHLLPNILPTLLTLFSFVFAGNIILESTLSFLGIGLSVGEVSWGSLLSDGIKYPQAWWLSLFPGIIIFLVILSLNFIIDRKISSDAKSIY